MSILKRELRQGFKPFVLWASGFAFLVLGGMVKFSGMEAMEGAGMGQMLSQFQACARHVWHGGGQDRNAGGLLCGAAVLRHDSSGVLRRSSGNRQRFAGKHGQDL